jgi:hypothetical protein
MCGLWHDLTNSRATGLRARSRPRLLAETLRFLSNRPRPLTRMFAEHPDKLAQWADFVEQVGGHRPPLREVIDQLADFLMHHAAKARALAGSEG